MTHHPPQVRRGGPACPPAPSPDAITARRYRLLALAMLAILLTALLTIVLVEQIYAAPAPGFVVGASAPVRFVVGASAPVRFVVGASAPAGFVVGASAPVRFVVGASAPVLGYDCTGYTWAAATVVAFRPGLTRHIVTVRIGQSTYGSRYTIERWQIGEAVQVSGIACNRSLGIQFRMRRAR